MAKKKNIIVEPEWSHRVVIEDLSAAQTRLGISPDTQALKALARRLDVIAVDSLAADLVIHKGDGGFSVYVKGHLKAEVTQKCVVTAEPVTSTIEEDFEGYFADHERAVSLSSAKNKLMMQKGQTEIQMMEEQDDPEPITKGQIDVGELTTQYLALAIDPYPHKDGVAHDVTDDVVIHKEEPAPERANPFAALKDWKNRHGTGSSSGSDSGDSETEE